MNGLYSEQKIWVKYNGTTTLATMNDLWEAYLSGELPSYQAFCFDPYEFIKKPEDRGDMIYTTAIPYVRNYHKQQLMTVATEDGETVVICASGALMDLSEYNAAKDVRPGPKIAIDARCFVSAQTEFRGEPGKMQIVRRIVDSAIGYGCVMSIPTPNMIAESGFVVLT